MSEQFIGKVLAGKYQVGEVFSESELGTIHHGTHLLMEKPVIIKILAPSLAVDAEIVRQFSAEAKTASRISHPNILNVTDFNADQNGVVYLVMESAAGDSLQNVLETEGRLSPERAFSVARQTAAALSAAHSAGIVHKSLNPENILLTSDAANREIVKVMNFGAIAPDYSQYSDEDGGFPENLKYFSPEQDSQISEPDERTDIYSLGAILYRMLAGDAPFTGVNATDLMFKKSEEPPAPLSAFRTDLPDGVETVILKALAKNPSMRQQSAAEFVEELNQATDFSNEQETIVIARQPEIAPQNNIWKTAFIVLAGISVMAIGLIYATSMKQTNPQTQMQYDANGQPVQPINPATGMNEAGASNMTAFSSNMQTDANMMMPETLPGGDGYDAWGRGVAPPPGAPAPYPSDQVYTIPGNTGSQFMQDDIILVPVPVNANTQPANTRTPAANQANAQVAPNAKPSPTAAKTPTEAKPTPANTPAAKPTEKPASTPAATTEKKIESGKKQDSEDEN